VDVAHLVALVQRVVREVLVSVPEVGLGWGSVALAAEAHQALPAHERLRSGWNRGVERRRKKIKKKKKKKKKKEEEEEEEEGVSIGAAKVTGVAHPTREESREHICAAIVYTTLSGSTLVTRT
jgi:hypothetical protein